MSVSQNNEQILNDIQSLQEMEQQLFTSLETTPTLTSQQQEQIVQKINQLSNMRVNLYETLSDVNNFYQDTLSSSVGTLQEQTVAIGIVESELNKAKKRLSILEDEKNNKIRLVEINNYYSDKYEEHSQLMVVIIFTLVPVIILSILYNKGFLPNFVYYILMIVIVFIGSYYFWNRYSSIIMRDSMNYQAYNWSFDPNKASKDSSKTTNTRDPWLNANVSGTCIGEFCCSDGQTWDASINQCTGSCTIRETFTESMVNNVLTKKQPNKFNTDVNMGDIEFPMTHSFINNTKIK